MANRSSCRWPRIRFASVLLLSMLAADLSADLRMRVRQQLMVLKENLSAQLGAALAQAYGIARPDSGTVRTDLDDGQTVLSLLPGFQPRPAGGASFEHNAQVLVDGLYAALHPKHPDFDPGRTGRAITIGDTTIHATIAASIDPNAPPSPSTASDFSLSSSSARWNSARPSGIAECGSMAALADARSIDPNAAASTRCTTHTPPTRNGTRATRRSAFTGPPPRAR